MVVGPGIGFVCLNFLNHLKFKIPSNIPPIIHFQPIDHIDHIKPIDHITLSGYY
jgi:hypothetical protein